LEDVLLESGPIQLRPATIHDLELLMAWRSHPEVYRHFSVQNRPLHWDEHYKFWTTRKNRLDWIIYYTDDTGTRKVGSVNITHLSDEVPEIGVFIGEVTLMGRGIGKQSVKMALNWLRSNGYSRVLAHISKANNRSQRLFASLGFIQCKDAQNGGDLLFEKILDESGK